MKTKIFDLKGGMDLKQLNMAAELIKKGELVAIPTETVYGLAADGLNPKAIRKIFKAKQRPMDNPLILHISKMEDLEYLAKNIKKEDIERLETLWPGPLTIVVEKNEIIPDEITAGLSSVAIRMPGHEITRKFIDYCETPLAAPSANLSTKPSPTNANSVLEDLNGVISGVIDAGDSDIGIESTVLDLTGGIPKILRPGYYTKELLETYWERVDIDEALSDSSKTPKSPGQKYKHYAPNTPVMVLIGEGKSFVEEIENTISQNKKIGLMIFEEYIEKFENLDIISIGNKSNLRTMAKVLFDALRTLDKKGLDLIVVQGVEKTGLGLSIMNRLEKSASGNVRRI